MARDDDTRNYLKAAAAACQDAVDLLKDDGGDSPYGAEEQDQIKYTARRLHQISNAASVKGVNALRWMAALTPEQAMTLARLYIQSGFQGNAEDLYLNPGPDDRPDHVAYESIAAGLRLLSEVVWLFTAAGDPGKGLHNRFPDKSLRLPLAREENPS